MLIPICMLLLAAGSQAGGNGSSVRTSIKSAEQSIDDRIQQLTGHTPFALLGKTRGAYLAGYGAVFTVEVNLLPVANVSPFRSPYSPQEIQNLNRQKRDKLGAFKAGVRQLLVNQAAPLGLVPASERIAIVVTLFNYNWEDTSGLPSQLVMQATRQSLLDLQPRRDDAAALEKAVELKEF